jgi:hypothetical protein
MTKDSLLKEMWDSIAADALKRRDALRAQASTMIEEKK